MPIRVGQKVVHRLVPRVWVTRTTNNVRIVQFYCKIKSGRSCDNIVARSSKLL